MDVYGLVHQKQLQVIVCTIHNVVLKRSNVKNHLQRFHKDQRHNHKAIAAIMDTWRISTELPPIDQAAIYPHIQGLPVSLGYQCPYPSCSTIVTTWKALQTHAQSGHNDFELPPRKSVSLVPVQRYSIRNYPPFQIQPLDCQPISKMDIAVQKLAALVEDTFTIPTEKYSDNARLTSPWLLRTNWPVIVGTHDVLALMDLCVQPTADDATLAKASQIVNLMHNQAIDMIGFLDELILQKINTPDPIKG